MTLKLHSRGYVPTFCFAVAAHGFEERDRTIEYLEKAYAEQDWPMCLLGIEPFFDDLREHPGFTNPVRRMNFPSATGRAAC